ncbi:TolC family protein [Achromobacter xylosoxidans]|uniref:Cobalt-zinc-cadmium resistance protein n=1 Tax=Alcaligenes xylosoxydans xylosoxydans TaxID=85698 RepID=A0A1R1K236_ALCXX|nr:TolC family protein [Achromobacter xylosoxidans]OMG93490.1 cobalt-zinc-cadmium resistance protein [Achromobacter xylosoxidans]
MRLSPILLALAAVLCLTPAWAQPGPASPTPSPRATPAGQAPAGQVLTLEQALETAYERSPLLAAARNEAASSEGQLTQAGVIPNPSIAVGIDDNRRTTRTTTTTLSMPVELGGKRAARVKAAGLARDIAQRDLSSARADLRAAVIAAFFDVAVAQETVRVSQGTVEIAQNALRLAERRVAAGKAPPLESSKARVELANSRIEARAADSALQAARRKLGQLWGAPQPDFAQVGADLGTLPRREAIDDLRAALATSPRMEAGRLSVEMGRAQLEVEKSKRYPDITLSAGVARDNEQGRNKAQFGVAIPLPLFDRNQGNVYSATMQSYKAQDMYRELESRLTADLLQSISQFDLAANSAREYRATVLPGAAEAYDSARKGFEAGKVSFLEVLDAQRTLSQGNIGYLNVLASAYQASADIDRILGR